MTIGVVALEATNRNILMVIGGDALDVTVPQ